MLLTSKPGLNSMPTIVFFFFTLICFISTDLWAVEKVFQAKGNGSTYLIGETGCIEAVDRSVFHAKNLCYSYGYTQCELINSTLITKRKAIHDQDHTQMGNCQYVSAVSGKLFDHLKAEDESERRN